MGFAEFGSECNLLTVLRGVKHLCLHELLMISLFRCCLLKAQRCQLSVTGPYSVTQASSRRTSMLTGCWLTTDRSYKSFLRAWCRRKCNVCMTDLDSPCTCVYQVDCSVRPPGYGGYASWRLWLQPRAGSHDLFTFSQRVSELAWSGSIF